MKLYAIVNALKDVNGKLIQVSKSQGSNQSLTIEILAEGLAGIPTHSNVYRISLNVGNNNELEAEVLDYSTGESKIITEKILTHEMQGTKSVIKENGHEIASMQLKTR